MSYLCVLMNFMCICLHTRWLKFKFNWISPRRLLSCAMDVLYYRIWIQSLSLASVHSCESCSVAHEAKMTQFPGSKNTRIRRCSSALLPHYWAHRASAIVSLALLDFPNVIRPNESSPNNEISHFVAVWTLKKYINWVTDISFPM